MIQLNELPPCLLVEIFSYLPINEVIRLKMVCKHWREISCYVRLKSLSVYQYDPKVRHDEFYLRYCKRYTTFDLQVNDFERFLKSTEQLLIGLKRLVCLFAEPLKNERDRMQDFLNRFRRLEELQIKALRPYELKSRIQFTLQLERLKKLFLRYTDATFDLNCPELSYVDVWSLEFCRICYPEKLRTLVSADRFEEDQIGKFVNLKNLIVLKIRDLNSIPRTFFEALPKSLQKLIFFERKMYNQRFSNQYNLEDCFRAQYGIDQEDSSGLRVFYLGVEIDLSRFISPGRVPNGVGVENFPNFLVTNLANSVNANVWFDHIDYNAFERLLPTFDPLYEKIYSVHANCDIVLKESVTDQVRLFEFIQKVKPACLKFHREAVFPHPFYDRITEICSSYIRGICFDAGSLESEPAGLDFLLKMTELEFITVLNSQLPVIQSLEFMIAAFEKIESLNTFDFKWLFIFRALSIRLSYYISDKDGDRQWKRMSACFDDDENEMDVLRGMVARLKQKRALRAPNITPEQNESEDLEELYSMIQILDEQYEKRFLKPVSKIPKVSK